MAGEQGILGDKGPDGDKGLAGEQGTQGEKGPDGDEGMAGDKGTKNKFNNHLKSTNYEN